MKRIIQFTSALLLTFGFGLSTAYAQSPEKMSYQAVIRDASNNLTTNQAVGMQISILQGGATGNSVYIETQSPMTNTNGLVSLEIGTGTTTDDFSTIDWTAGPYFIKTETDPTTASGTNYTITGTTQLMSVPYALHAKTAEMITGTVNYSETDPVFGASIANGITATDTANWNNKLTTEIDGSVTNEIQTISRTGTTVTLSNGGGTFTDSVNVYIAGDGITVTGTTISEKKYQIGDFAQGGIVFWVDETGEHGLICAKTDQSTGVRWYAGTYGYTQAKGNGPYAGEANTAIIIAAQVAIGDDNSTYAARICNELQITESGKTYGDWYLPSEKELNLMYQNRGTINTTASANGGSSFASTVYWSSTESNSNNAWNYYFGNGSLNSPNKISTSRVRAVRAF